MSSNNKGLFVIGMLLIVLMAFSYVGNFNLSKIATDSGFDTSYDSGGSDWGGNSDWGSDSSGGDGDITVFLDETNNIVFGSFIVFFLIILFVRVADTKPRIVIAIIIFATILLAIIRLLLLSIVFGIVGFFIIGIPVLMLRKSNSTIEKSLKKRNYLPKNEENLEILKEGYEIFTNVQYAWMNFDYDKLREVTTDELYNMYYNQLQTLHLKGQINKMHDFELINYELVKIEKNNGLVTTTMELEVSFYDYIVDNNGKIVHGNEGKKVHMLYDLTFVHNELAIKECPNCNAPITPETTTCSHCNTRISSVRNKMKLSTKKCLRQR